MKKFISILLVTVMLFTSSVTAFAAGKANTGITSNDPVVLVRGMDFTNLLLNPGTSNEHKAFELNTQDLVVAAGKTLLQWLAFDDKDGAVDTLIDAAYELLKYNSMAENGDPAYNTGMKKYPESLASYPELIGGTNNEMGMLTTFSETFGADHVYYVNYDWRVDPLVVADEIDYAVKKAKADTGAKKVNIVCASMGGIMSIAYFTKYGYDSVGRCLFCSSTFCGSEIVGDVLNGRVEITPERLYEYLKSLVSGDPSTKLLLEILYKVGLFDWATGITDYILKNKKTELYEEVLKPVFAYSPCIWGLVSSDEDYESAIKYMFGSRENVNETFLNRIDALRDMMHGRDALLNEMVENGVGISVLSNYGSPLIPVYESACLSGDRTLEAYNTSGFATVAKYGETLGSDYVAANPALVSPDNCVDLSTAVLPEYTYMIKNAPHVSGSYGTDYSKFIVYLLTNTGDFKAGSNPNYPQFMVSDLENQSLRAFA